MKIDYFINHEHVLYAAFHTEKEMAFRPESTLYGEVRWIPADEGVVAWDAKATGKTRLVCEIHFVTSESLTLYGEAAEAYGKAISRRTAWEEQNISDSLRERL